ncbi:hypothetical protein AB4440_24290 [Vibrio splendidus]|uniref:hypothetical protein n=1 Tax=Vibrio splendidus TaxID=29497 RepID=UPI000C85D4A9|nr:hypothetical protein [Vibrio splendidus]PMO90623.1 hypothetical protein BCS97_22550 [Vibrio splendidus]PMP17714.1 hypothetical protein BCS89_22505 [Vibrio splendidus]PMP37168.1 hypothetical protein BCS88_24235 [Vibrio splendidus]PMP42597.1 hypothetical protein BCS87_24350 [Vibrio splendidus]PMP51233.1 hypothetical protein BCS85_24275 [Vibrio splendidus]
MKGRGYKILSKLEKSGELTLAEIAELIPKTHNDHKDFYVFASLVSSGLVDDFYQVNENGSKTMQKEQILARKFFACSTATTKAEYENLSWSAPSSSLKDQPFALSGKGSLLLSEARTKRSDRIFTLISGMLVGTLVAVIGAFVRSSLG